jgi:hypothetical protein
MIQDHQVVGADVLAGGPVQGFAAIALFHDYKTWHNGKPPLKIKQSIFQISLILGERGAGLNQASSSPNFTWGFLKPA